MSRTDFLFATPSFLTGAGRTLDLFGGLDHVSYNYSQTPAEADQRALESDWEVVWGDFRAAVDKVAATLR